ncbi:MAG: hypothetical protein JW810_00150 [Sedimentisphaerales bacterium]|nr:hypothetical protein [Sedimentisphaerales bacterium]
MNSVSAGRFAGAGLALRLGILAAMGLELVSCQAPGNPAAGPLVLADPVAPLAGTDPASQQAAGQLAFCGAPDASSAAGGPVMELLLAYVSSGRDFREPPGPDGYLLRLIPLDDRYRPLPIDGLVTVGLYDEEGLDQAPERRSLPILIWRIETGQLGAYWVPARTLDGYFFRLDWGRIRPGPGNYRLVVHVQYRKDEQTFRFCREMSFQDRLGG